MKVGDIVKLKADNRLNDLMTVIGVERTCDGTGGDGAGLFCSSTDPKDFLGWLSESSVEIVFRPKDNS